MSQGYNTGNGGMFLCKLLVGKPYLCRQRNGRGLEPGFTSHVSNAEGSEVRQSRVHPHRVHSLGLRFSPAISPAIEPRFV